MSNIIIAGAQFSDVTQIDVPKVGGGLASFLEGGGGGSNTETGTFTISSAQTATTTVTITTLRAIPKAVMLIRTEVPATVYYISDAFLAMRLPEETPAVSQICYRNSSYYNSSAGFSTNTNHTVAMSTAVHGHLLVTSALKLCFRASTSRLLVGTYRWIAIY